MIQRIFCVFAYLLAYCQLVFGQDNTNNSINHGISFVPNQGQIADRFYNPRPDVLFQVAGKGIFLRKTGISYLVSNIKEVEHEVHEIIEEIEEKGEGFGLRTEGELQRQLVSDALYELQQVSMYFEGANPDFQVESSGFFADYLNYYLPHCTDGITGVKTRSNVAYRNIYSGIDVNFYGGLDGGLKYDFMVYPEADPNQIKLKWAGADSVLIDDTGKLILKTQIEPITETLPRVYQVINGAEVGVEAKYRLDNNPNGEVIVSFELGNYNPEETLIIDPWVTNYGGDNSDYGLRVDTDRNGFIYMLGITNSVENIYEDGFQSEVGGLVDGFLTCFDQDGVRQWGTYYGGEFSEEMGSVTCDRENGIYICGSTPSHTGIAEGGHQNEISTDPMTDSGVDAFLVKFNNTGIREWGTYYGGTSIDNGFGVCTDSELNVYLSGSTGSADGIALDGHDMTVSGIDAFLVKFTSAGTRLWATYYGGFGTDVGQDVTVDSLNRVFLGGPTSSTTEIAFEGHDDSFNGGIDLFVAKFSEDGDRIWGTYTGGEAGEGGGYLAADTLGNIYISGNTSSTMGIGIDGFQMTLATGGLWDQDAFVTKYDPDGVLLWSTYYGGNDRDYSLDCAVDPKTNHILISGDSYSTDLAMSTCAIQPTLVGLENVFLIHFFEDGTLFCSSYFGLSHEEDNTIAIHECYTYITGTTPFGLATPGSHQEEFGGVSDAFLAQIYTQSCGLEYPTISIEAEQENVPVCGDCIGSASIEISAEGCYGRPAFFSYEWSTGLVINQTMDTVSAINDLCPGNYWVAVTYNCDQVDTVFFEIELEGESPITVNFTAPDVCLGDPTNFINESFNEPEGPITSQWYFGDSGSSTDSDPTHIFGEPGTYEVTLIITNETGCEDSVKIEVEVFPTYHDTLAWVICDDSTVVFPDGMEEELEGSIERTYNFETIHGCDSTIVVEVIVNPAYFFCDTLYVDPYTTLTYPDGTQQTVPWSTQHSSNFYTEEGCDSIILTKVIVQQYEQELITPNIFTPDGDPANSRFFFPNKGVADFHCVIVNRWGVEVYRFDSVEESWNGIDARTGNPCVDGVYFYTYVGNFISGEAFNGQGTIQLVRK